MHSSISSFERKIPGLPWTRLMVATCLLTLAAATAWEIRCRAWGYAPTLNDTPDLWAERRNAVQPDSLVIIGDSRAWFDLDLDEIEHGVGRRPVQLAIPGSCAYPVLADLANDKGFHGTVICSVVPIMFFAPAGPPLQNAYKAINRRLTQTLAQRTSNRLGMLLEEHIAFLKEDDLTLGELLGRINIPNRAGALVAPPLPPYFETLDRERRARMFVQCASPGPLQDRVKFGWLPLFTPPPPPTYVPHEAFVSGVGHAVEARFADAASAVERIRARGGKVVFVRLPVSGDLKKLEDRATPRAGPWNRLLKESGAPGIYFEDYPELAGFECPEWSHLSAPDSVEFTRRLIPHLLKAIGGAGGFAAAETRPAS
jgi:hypothetical protein